MKPEPAALLLAVNQEAGNRIDLVAHVEPERTDRRQVAEARADVFPEIAEIEIPRVVPHVAGIGEEHAAQVAPDRHAQLGGALEHRVPADRDALEERRHFEPPPAAQAGGAAEKIASEERDAQVIAAGGSDRAAARL